MASLYSVGRSLNQSVGFDDGGMRRMPGCCGSSFRGFLNHQHLCAAGFESIPQISVQNWAGWYDRLLKYLICIFVPEGAGDLVWRHECGPKTIDVHSPENI